LYKKFIYEDQSASSATSFQWSSEIASRFVAYLNVKEGQDPEKLKIELEAEISQFIAEGPTDAELKRVKAAYFANFIKGLERIGGFGGVSDILASNQTYHGDASYYKTQLKYVEDATAEDLRNTAKKWLTKGKHVLVCEPFPEYAIEQTSVDRSKLPELGPQKSSEFPNLQRTNLSNGLEVVLAQRTGVPTMILNLVADAGYKTDHISSPGTAELAMNLMDEGTKDMNSLQINEQLQLLGASLSTFSNQDQSNVYMSTLKPSFDASLNLFADVLLNPEFPQKEFERLKNEQINDIKQEKSQPVAMALRVMNKYLYGDDHPYSSPYTGTGYEETVDKLTRDDITKFYDTWIKPNNSTLVVTGDISMSELKPKLERALGKWKKGDVPQVTFSAPKTNTKNTLYLMNRPESQQSVIIAGHLTDKYGGVSEVALEQMVNILGGDFTSRINMNLREDKHWSYGAGGFVLGSKEERPFILYAPVQTDKTSESVTELRKEITDFITTRPATQEELDKVKTNQVLKLPGQWETNSSVNSSVTSMLRYGLPDNYYKTYDQSVRDLSLNDIKEVSKTVVKPEAINWFMVGDRAKIINKLDELGFDDIIEIDADGNPVVPAMNQQGTDIKN
jgi:predicted Zn-dependent peptidase